MTRAEEIADGARRACARASPPRAGRGSRAGAVPLVAVSKKMPADDVRAALAAGQRDFGENYAQELRDKRAAAGGDDAPRRPRGTSSVRCRATRPSTSPARSR